VSAMVKRLALLACFALAAPGAQAQFNLRNLDINKLVDTAKNAVKATAEIGEQEEIGIGRDVAARLLGAVLLAFTGAEALYADLGHFGRRPIRLAWFAVVLPALLLNYFGQGALILRIPAALESPFYLMAPRPLLYPLVAIATVATVVASQALISGAFSLTHQCVQLRYSPRVSIVHTSRSEMGQIYIPEVNAALMIGCLVLVVGFGSSTALGGAYGVAVTGTMAVTTVLFCVLARQRWRWPAWRARPA